MHFSDRMMTKITALYLKNSIGDHEKISSKRITKVGYYAYGRLTKVTTSTEEDFMLTQRSSFATSQTKTFMRSLLKLACDCIQ